MKISICLPVFDRSEMLGNALDSILKQTHSDFEVVIKDGCLARPAIVSGAIREQKRWLGARLKYVLSKDCGIFPALNEALEFATGDVLYFMCSDDELAGPDSLERVSKEFEGRTVPYWAYGQTQMIGEWGERLDVSGQPTTLNELLERNRIGQPSAFWNRPMFERIGNFRYRHAADYDYWIRCFRVATPKFMPHVLGCFRKWGGQSTEQHIAEVEEEAEAIREWHRNDIAQAKPVVEENGQ